jgi:hypothetical protein
MRLGALSDFVLILTCCGQATILRSLFTILKIAHKRAAFDYAAFSRRVVSTMSTTSGTVSMRPQSR